jgi:hypothetical protein
MENRRLNFSPKFWGIHGWKFLNHIALSFPNNPTPHEKKIFKDFFYSLQHVLPCENCCKNFKEHIKEIPIDNYLKDSHTLFKWVIDIQNILNKKLNKKLLNHEELKKQYYNQGNSYFNLNYKTKVIIFFISSISILYLLKKMLKIKIIIKYNK